MSTKKKIFIVLVTLAILLFLIVVIAISPTIFHQIYYMRFENSKFLNKLDGKYGRESIILLCYSKSPLTKVLRQRGGLDRGPCYFETKWRSIRTKTDNIYIVVVQYTFDAGAEWYLEVFSKDNHWMSMSPYFGKVPNLSEEQEKWLWNLPPDAQIEVKYLFPDFTMNSGNAIPNYPK